MIASSRPLRRQWGLVTMQGYRRWRSSAAVRYTAVQFVVPRNRSPPIRVLFFAGTTPWTNRQYTRRPNEQQEVDYRRGHPRRQRVAGDCRAERRKRLGRPWKRPGYVG